MRSFGLCFSNQNYAIHQLGCLGKFSNLIFDTFIVLEEAHLIECHLTIHIPT